MSNLHVIAYDTPHDRTRRRLSTILEGYGDRVQDSLFECWLEAGQREALIHRLRRTLNARTDKLRIYVLCGKDVADVLQAGVGNPPHERDAPVV